jgi:CBS-domain-containing membrane protein
MIEVGDVMTRDVVSVPRGMSLKDAGRLLVEHRISGVPVVDGDARVLGVLSTADVLPKEVGGVPYGRRAVNVGAKLEAVTVGQAMTAPALTIEPQRPISSAAGLMLEYDVARLPVVFDGNLVGIVTRTDLIRAFVRSDADVAREIREEVARLRMEDDAVSVAVDDGAVTLAGRVDNGPDAEALTLFAKRVPGVVSVDCELTWSDTDPDL